MSVCHGRNYLEQQHKSNKTTHTIKHNIYKKACTRVVIT